MWQFSFAKKIMHVFQIQHYPSHFIVEEIEDQKRPKLVNGRAKTEMQVYSVYLSLFHALFFSFISSYFLTILLYFILKYSCCTIVNKLQVYNIVIYSY